MVEVGQQAGEPLGQHRLAGARRSVQQQVVATGRRHLEGEPRVALPEHVAQVETGDPILAAPAAVAPVRQRLDRRVVGRLLAQQQRHHVPQGPRADDLDPVDLRGLTHVGLRHQHPGQPRLGDRQRRRQHPRHRSQPPVEGQLAEQHGTLERGGRDHPGRGDDGHGDRQVVVRARLGQRRR